MHRIEDLALVEAMVGKHEEALRQLDDLLSQNGEVSAHLLLVDPRWDPLKSNLGFERLLTKHDDK
jgi:hypothetical protein